MNEHLSSSSLKSLAKGQLLGKYGTLTGACALHIICVTFATFGVQLFISDASVIGTIMSFAVSFIISLFTGLFVFGEAYIYLKLACNQKVAVRDLFYGFSRTPDKILKVQAVLALISTVCNIPNYIFSFSTTSLFSQPYILLLCVVLLLVGSIINIILSLMFSQCFYLMLDFPQYTAGEVLRQSCRVMRGSKGRLFYIDLSFMPLILLGLCTFGIAFLWILPYYQSTRANFYLDLMKKR